MKFPDDLSQKEPLRDFLVAYGESHPITRDMKGARAFTREGHTFIVMDGMVAYQEPGDALSRRVSVALALPGSAGICWPSFLQRRTSRNCANWRMQS